MKIFKILLISTLFLSAGDKSIDIAKEQEKIVKKVFNLYDRDSSGKLDFKEFAKFNIEIMKKGMDNEINMLILTCDRNKNGIIDSSDKITTSEFEKIYNSDNMQGQRVIICSILSDLFEIIDTNHDNKITKDELLVSVLKDKYALDKRYSVYESSKKKIDKISYKIAKTNLIKRLKNCDKNHDNQITLIELTSKECKMHSEFFLMQTKDINGSFSLQNVKFENTTYKDSKPYESTMHYCDINRDNRITLVEATSNRCFASNISSEEFLEIDINKDGYITKQEISLAQDKYKKKKLKKLKLEISNIGKVSKSEVIRKISKLCNSDKNSYIDKKEARKCEISEKEFNMLDIDKNSIINSDDLLMLEIEKNFTNKDLNKDKMLDFKEFKRGFSGQCSAF